MKKSLLIAFFLISMASFAQTDSSVSSSNRYIYIGLGSAGQTFSGLNNRIASRPEYQSIKSTEFNLSAGWVMQLSKTMLDLNLSFGGTSDGTFRKQNTTLTSFSTSLNIGYNLSSNKKIRLSPFIGLGTHSFAVKLDKDLSSIPFDSVLQSSSWQQKTVPLSFSNTFFAYRIGIAIDFIENQYCIGIRAGYTRSFENEEWRINETQSLYNAPTDKLSRWFVGVQLMKKYKKDCKR